MNFLEVYGEIMKLLSIRYSCIFDSVPLTFSYILFQMKISENDEWVLIEELNKCNETALEGSNVVRTRKIDECAAECKGRDPIFAFGTNDFGGNGCNEGLCKCICIDELDDDKCKTINYNDYWFLRFKEKFEPSGKQF